MNLGAMGVTLQLTVNLPTTAPERLLGQRLRRHKVFLANQVVPVSAAPPRPQSVVVLNKTSLRRAKRIYLLRVRCLVLQTLESVPTQHR